MVKRAGAVPPKAARTRSSRSALPAYARCDSTLDDEEHAATSAKRKKEKESLDTSVRRCVKKCIRDNLATMTEQEMHNVIVDGVSCFGKLMRDKTVAMTDPSKAETFGKKYFADLRAKYSVHTDREGLEVREDKDIDPELFEAVSLSRDHMKRDKLIRFCMSSAHVPHQGEVCGILTHGLEIKPVPYNLQVNLAMLKWIHRMKIKERFPAEFQAYAGHMDQILMGVHASMKAKGYRNKAFWDPHKYLCELYMPAQAVERLFACNETWVGHEGDIEVVCRSGLGLKMFGYAQTASRSLSLGTQIDQLIREHLPATQHITSKKVDETLQLVSTTLSTGGVRAEEFEKPRAVSVKYRQDDVKVKVVSLWDEITVRMAVYLKCLAVLGKKNADDRHSQLPPLFLENDLDPLGDLRVVAIDDEVLANYSACRRAANEQVTPARQRAGESVQTFLQNNLEVLSLIDPTMKVEAAWYDMMYNGGAQTRLQDQIMKLMPTAAAPGDPQTTASQLDDLKKTVLFSFANDEAHSVVNVVAEWARCLASFRPPNLKVPGDAFLQQVKEKLEFFLHTGAASGSAGSGVVSGKGALKHIVDALGRKFETKEPVTLQDLQLLDAYSWLLTADQKTLHQGWVKKIFTEAGSSEAVSTTVGKAPAEQTAGKKKPSQATSKAKASPSSTMSLFKTAKTT